MADNRNDELEEAKRFVRSVLQSEKEGIPLRRFESAYDELVGESVPFRRFGFRTIIDFIAAIGDTARFEFRHNERYVTFVSSEKTAHIEELVRGQKSIVSKSAPKHRYNFRPNFSRGYYNAPKSRVDFYSKPRSDSAYNGMHYANPPHNQKLPTYEPWLAVSQQQNNWQNNLQMSNQMRNTLPSQSYEAYRPPVVSTQSPIVSRTTSTSMQSNSGYKTGNNKFENFTVTRDVSNAEKSPLRVNMNEVEAVVAIITTANSTLTITTITTTATAVTISSATTHDQSRPTHVNSNTTTTSAATVTPILSTTITRALESPKSLASQHMFPNSKVADEDELESSPTPPSSPVFSSMAVSNFRHILSQHKDGIPACLFAREYRNSFGVEFDSNIWGYKSPMEMFHCLRSVFAIQQPTPDNEKIFPGYGEEIFLHDARHKSFPDSKPKTTDAVDLCYLSYISDKVMANTLKLIELDMPQGLALPKFIDEYRFNFGDINLPQMRISDTCQFFKLVEQVLPIEVKMMDATKRAFLKSATHVEAFLCNSTRMGRHIFAKTMIEGSLPADVAMPGDVLTDLELPPHVKVGDNQYVAVLLSSVKDPSNLCIQFKGEQYHNALEYLMADLDFYASVESNMEWRVPKAFLCVGLPVVTKFPVDRNWHRARIIQILDEHRVTLSFVDYGGIITTNIKNVFLMKKQFMNLPMQCLRVGIYGVKPVLDDKRWTVNARDDLLDRFSKSNYYLACTFMKKIHSHYYLVCLCDTNDKELDVFVHEYLVQQQHAVYDYGVVDSNDICADGTEQNYGVLEGNQNIQNDNEIKMNMNQEAKYDLDTTLPVIMFDIKWIEWKASKVPIIMQNTDHSCPAIALVNALSLTRRIIVPNKHDVIDSNEIIEQLANYVLDYSKLDINLVDLLDDLKLFFRAIDVTPRFVKCTQFDCTHEIRLFELLNIPLMHGWIVDPNGDPNVYSVMKDLSYEMLIYLSSNSIESNSMKARIAKQFVESTPTQLTEYGLNRLYCDIMNEQIAILYRNHNFSVIYKKDSTLYQLVTDSSFKQQNDIVWETLTNINCDEQYVNSDFRAINFLQQQIDYEFAMKLQQQFDEEYVAIDSNEANGGVNNGENETNLKAETIKDDKDNQTVLNNQNSSQINSTINISDDTSSVLYLSSSAIQANLNANQKLAVVEELLEEQKIIDAVNDEELENLIPPLIPQSVSAIDSPKPVISLNKDYSDVNLDELRQTAEQIINEPNRSQSSINSSPKKLVSNITITSNLGTGERKIVNGCAHSFPDLTMTLPNNQSLASADSKSDDNHNKRDVPLTHKVCDQLDYNSIISAKLKTVLIGSKSYDLIYFMDSFYFTYFSVNEMFRDVPLWQLIRKSSAFLKDRIQFGECDGRKLFSHLNIEHHLRNGTAFLYTHESVSNFASISKLRPIKQEINSNVKLFYKEILIDEKNKLLEKQRIIDYKLMNL